MTVTRPVVDRASVAGRAYSRYGPSTPWKPQTSFVDQFDRYRDQADPVTILE
ncbi:hypothetical protein ACKVMT_03825 [Halobacteriales archaeon Cl-PHB]